MVMITSNYTAPQHGPRPLPLFLSHLWAQSQNDTKLQLRALAGLKKYQHAARTPLWRMGEAEASAGTARLLKMSKSGSKAKNLPVVLVPSIVNPPHILDLSERMSLACHLENRGHDPYLVDWGYPTSEDADMGLDRHVSDRLLPLLRALERPPIVVGYCLGGTLSIAAAGLMPQIAGLATIAAPWDFDLYPPESRKLIADLWKGAQALSERLGYAPMEVLQSGFWSLDPARTIRKYAAFADMEEASEEANAFIAVEDWANEGAPLTYAAARDLFDHLYRDNLTGLGKWEVERKPVAPSLLSCPTLTISSTTDRIVPLDASPNLGDRIESALGHVGMIVSRKAPAEIWTPLSVWLSKHGG
jgi:polyhydroxyalkanoate synthase